MPKRKAIHSIIVLRKDKRITVSPGEEFDFTDAEIEEINESNSEAISTEGTVDLTADDSSPAPKKTGKAAKADADL